MRLPQPVPLRVVYTLAEVRNDTLYMHANVYKRATAPYRVLAMRALALVLDTTAVNQDVLARATKRSPRTRVALPLDSLRQK